MNIIKAMAQHLEFEGFGTVSQNDKQGNIFWGLMPDKPDDCICVFSNDSSYAGSPNGARVQIVTRARSVKAAYDLSQAIAETLADYDGFLHGDGAQVIISATNTSAGLGSDEKKRELFSSNYAVKYCDY